MKYLLAATLTVLALGLYACDAPTQMDDAGITAKVKSKMAVDSRTSALKVSVDTLNGVVTLTGIVPNETEKNAAGEIASTTEGVKSVNNNIAIDASTTSVSNIGAKTAEAAKSVELKTEAAAKEVADDLSDAGILAKIKAKYVAEGIMGTNVDVVDGVATLQGTVDDASEKTRAEQIALSTNGVKSVKNQLMIGKKK